VCCGSIHLSAGMSCRSGLMASLVENRFSALACALEHRVVLLVSCSYCR
ncbi:unnamed protein product, partial [Ectocarpus fasciculatus]